MKNLFKLSLLILTAQAQTSFDAKDVYHTCEVMGVSGAEELKNCLQRVVNSIKSKDADAGEIA